MKALHNIRIKYKLVLMVLFPLVGLIYLAYTGLETKDQIRTEMSAMNELSQFAVLASLLVHETQKERGMTAGYLGSKGADFKAELTSQRSNTDSRVQELESFLAEFDASAFGSEFDNILSQALDELHKRNRIRSSVTSLNIQPKEAIGYYTAMNGRFLDGIAQLITLSTDAEISNLAAAYVNFLMAKERAGIERAVLSSTFAMDQFGPGVYRKFISLMTEQDSYTKEFLRIASTDSKNFYQSKLSGQTVDDVQNMRDIALANATEGGFGVDAALWFKTITKKINRLKEVDDHLSTDLRAVVGQRLAAAAQAATIYVLGSIAIIVVTLILFFVIARAITGPIITIGALAEEIAKGNVKQSITIDTRDEIGILAESLRKLVAYITELSAAAESIATNDLTAEIEPKSEKDVLGHSFKTMTTNLTGMVRRLSENAGELVSAATEIASTSEQMSRGSNDQAQQVAQVSTAVEEMSATIVESSRNAGEATEASKGASSTAGTGGKIVNDTRNGMKRIADVVTESAESIGKLETSAQQIGEIITVIDDIADQTNLLALNAAIEAARAGEQGRGFAVVADEVRKLAERTGRATGEITAMIKGIQGQTKDAVVSMNTGVTEVENGRELAEKAGVSLEEIVSVSGRVVDMIQQIATATEEQSVAAEQITKNIEGISSIAGETAKGAEQSATAADQLSRQADSLQRVVSQFQVVGTSEN